MVEAGQHLDALEKAKEVTNKEKNLRKQRETSNTADLINIELSFAEQGISVRADTVFGLMQPVKNAAFVEDRCFR